MKEIQVFSRILFGGSLPKLLDQIDVRDGQFAAHTFTNWMVLSAQTPSSGTQAKVVFAISILSYYKSNWCKESVIGIIWRSSILIINPLRTLIQNTQSIQYPSIALESRKSFANQDFEASIACFYDYLTFCLNIWQGMELLIDPYQENIRNPVRIDKHAFYEAVTL